MLVKDNKQTLFSMTAGYRHLYVGAAFAMLGTSLFMFSAPLLGGGAIDVIKNRNLDAGDELIRQFVNLMNTGNPLVTYLVIASVISVLMTCVAGGFLYFRGRWAALASEAIVRSLRETLYRHLHHVRADFYDTAETGDLVQRSSSDVETVRVFLASDLVEIGRAVMLVVTMFPILFWLNAKLALISVCLLPFLVVGAYIFFSKVKHVFELTDKAEGAMTSTLQENLTGIRVVRAFARQAFESRKFGEKNALFRDHNYRLIRLMAFYWSTSDFFAMTQIGLVLFAGAGLVAQGAMTDGELFTFITCVAMVIWPVRQLGRVLTDTGKAVVALERINAVTSTIREEDHPVPAISRTRGAISMTNLSFSYQDHTQTLRDLNITIAPGETLAIVGPPGSGKSTIIRLLLKLYNYTSGSLKIDDLEVRDTNRHWLRQQISVVLQEPFLYSKSVRENIVVGLPDATDDALRRACADAAVLKTIEAFPKGFASEVGERGVTLSGGQRQRLALARALIKDPPILVLDDSLSSVDTGTEALILTALERRHGRHTTLIIAHRLSSIAHADRIMVLEDGAITQLGSHRELIAQPGFYGRLCELQQTLDESIRADIEQGRKENV